MSTRKNPFAYEQAPEALDAPQRAVWWAGRAQAQLDFANATLATMLPELAPREVADMQYLLRRANYLLTRQAAEPEKDLSYDRKEVSALVRIIASSLEGADFVYSPSK